MTCPPMRATSTTSATAELRGASRPRSGAAWASLATGLCALALYALTCAPGVEWQDSGFHQYRIITGSLEHPYGLALSHPLHYWAGRAALRLAGADPARLLNLMSGVFGALAVGVFTFVLARFTRSRLAAVLAGATLALAHPFWSQSVVTETYTLAAALLTVEWLFLLRYVRTQQPGWLAAVFAANGLHVANHLLGLLTLAPLGVLLLERAIRRRCPWRWVLAALLCWVVAAAPYWTLVLDHYQRTGDLGATLQSAFFGGSSRTRGWTGSVLNVRPSPTQMKLAALTFGYAFPSAAGLLALWGLFQRVPGRRRVFRRVVLVQTVLIVSFVSRYSIADLYTYFVPVCVVTAFWLGVAVAALLRRARTAEARRWTALLLTANAVLPVGVYGVFPIVAKERGWMRGQMRSIPFRDEYLHFFRPWRYDERSAARFSQEILMAAGSDGWILADSTTAFPVALTCLLEGRPPGVRVYWNQDRVLPPGLDPLSNDELHAYLERGGQAIAVPRATLEQIIPPPLTIEKSAPFWRVLAGGRAGASGPASRSGL